MKRFFKITLALIAVGLLGACSQGEAPSSDNEKIQVVASFYPMYDFTRNIVGDEGDVELLIDAGTDSHDYEPSARDIVTLQEADVFVYNNENMETWVSDVTDTVDGDLNIVKATEGMLLMPGNEDEHDHEEEGHDHEEEGHSHAYDPHVWLSPRLAIEQVEIIRDQLSELYPDKATAFEENAAAYIEKLTALDDSYKTAFDGAIQTKFVTQHTAFSYLALEYGLTQVPIAGISPNEEPSAARLAELKDFVDENDIKVIYFEENATASIAETLATETGVELAVLNPLEGLSSEQMEAGEDYISVMEDNMEALQLSINSDSSIPIVTKETEKTVYNGYFEDADVQDRPLSDWAGEWQSVYPYLQDGSFDQVFEYREKQDGQTVEESKAYYETGYKTDVAEINITDDSMEFILADGSSEKSTYNYVGYEILNYEAGNRGVRYLFEATDEASPYRYVQFSDHGISPTDSGHFHIYFGNESQEALLEEVDNWPTYYPTSMDGLEIAQEMLAH